MLNHACCERCSPKTVIAPLVANAGDAGQRGRLDVTGVRDAVGGEVCRAERELVGLQRGEQVAVSQLAAHHLQAFKFRSDPLDWFFSFGVFTCGEASRSISRLWSKVFVTGTRGQYYFLL